ncbi:DUF5807 family protein [Natranaeroarchaeum sulfidigenes]|uniref:Uncharacterized protein n=1 Tax=Natranaeroarchaeum sulfidigenes TaxID=2784880 RepID=A0A897MRB1_9EURY|nr:DUF5807 family protein [Natranaeroarchaeum sulfidigenes]QSG01553.1 Uncharacterized protein AArcS_0319 [Natranaeroarchaeum sulfidigenes]
MTEARAEFLAGERTEDVAFFLADEAVDNPDKLDGFGERVDGGHLLIVDGEAGRAAFQSATGTDAMGFAKKAMGTEGEIDRSLTGGTCPDGADHDVRFVFAFAEEQNEEVGGLYGEGDVIHAYAQCDCGTAYSHKWVVGERDE